MEVQIESPEKGKKELTIQIPQEKLNPKFEEAYQEYRKKIVLGGFRKGKVPVSLVKQMFGKSIRQEVLKEVIPEYAEEILEKHNIKIISQPAVDNVLFDEVTGLSFRILAEVEPEIELTKITDFELEKIKYEIDEKALDDNIEALREEHATMNPVDGPVKENDYVLADFQQIDESGLPLVGKKRVDQLIQINMNDPSNAEINRQFIGKQAGDKFRVVYQPQDSGTSSLHYEVTLKEVKSKELPELDNEFAKDIGNFETLEALYTAIREELEIRAERESSQRYMNEVADMLVKNNPFDLPEKMINNRLDLFIQQIREQNERLEKPQEFNESAIRDRYRVDVIWNIRWEMIRDKIVEQEKLDLTEDDFEDYFVEIATLQGTDVDRVRNRYLTPESRSKIASQLLDHKVIDFVEKHSKVTEKTVLYSQI